MNHSIVIYLAVAAAMIYLIRVLPMTLIRRDIKNPFIRSFLYYVPYVTLAVMTFPSILSATGSAFSAWAGFLTGLVLAYVDGNLFRVAICSCIAVYLVELLYH
jgi:branched-subunit amino acid transport protein